MTNFEKIHLLSVDEMAKFLCDVRSLAYTNFPCSGCAAEYDCKSGHIGFIDWLNRENGARETGDE